MGQTLTNGIYLPAEGERNCYDGLEGNWRSLDGLISTVAGKASATHTHGNITNDGKVGTAANKPLITGTGGAVQAGSFGTLANTFCEGNDSRLSDARTPVAHTHGKADITDLFNSANTWSGGNTYTATINYQASYTLGNPPQSATSQVAIKVTDTAGSNYLAHIAAYQDTSLTGLRFTIRDKFDSNGFSPSGSNRNKYLSFLQNASNRGYLQWDGYINNNIIPLANNSYDLGSSTLKWKTLNGVNPGALSLPDTSKAEAISTSGFSFDGTSEQMPDTTELFANGVAQKNGWLVARLSEGANHFVFLNSDEQTGRSGILSSCLATNSFSGLIYGLNACVPITAGGKPSIRWAKPNGGNAILYFVPSLGNV